MSYKVLEVNVDDNGNGGVYSLIKNVIEDKPKNLIIDIATIEHFENKKNIEYLNKLGTRVVFVGYSGNKIKKQEKVYQNLKKYLQKEHYDCVHIHSDVANKYIAAGLAAKKAGVKKIIFHSHSSGVDSKNSSKKVLFHKVSRHFLKYIATDYVACSDVAATWMFPDIPDRKIKIIKNGINLDKFKFNRNVRNKVRSKLNLSNSFVIGHVGRFTYQKNQEYLLSILKVILKRKPNTVLLLVGEGPQKSKIQKKAKEEKLIDHIIFYGLSSHVNDLLQAMDVFVLPSHFEGLPIVGVEAQAADLPVIFSDKITKEAKVLDNVDYLSINDASLEKWVNDIIRFSSVARNTDQTELFKKKFDISDTILEFTNLYK